MTRVAILCCITFTSVSARAVAIEILDVGSAVYSLIPAKEIDLYKYPTFAMSHWLNFESSSYEVIMDTRVVPT